PSERRMLSTYLLMKADATAVVFVINASNKGSNSRAFSFVRNGLIVLIVHWHDTTSMRTWLMKPHSATGASRSRCAIDLSRISIISSWDSRNSRGTLFSLKRTALRCLNGREYKVTTAMLTARRKLEFGGGSVSSNHLQFIRASTNDARAYA